MSLIHSDEFMVTSEKGGLVKTWQLGNSGYEHVATLEGNHEGYCRMDMSVTKHTIACPTGKNSIAVCNPEGLEIMQTLKPPDDENLGILTMLKMNYISGVDYVLAGYESGDIMTFDTRNGKVVQQRKFDDCALAADYEPSLNQGYFGGQSNMVSVFGYKKDTMEMDIKKELPITNPGVNVIRIRPDQKVFAVGGSDGRIRVYSWRSLRPLTVLTEHKQTVTDIAYSEGRVLMWKAPIMAAASADGSVSLWNIYNSFN